MVSGWTAERSTPEESVTMDEGGRTESTGQHSAMEGRMLDLISTPFSVACIPINSEAVNGTNRPPWLPA